MANFKTHISTSTVLGVGYATGAYLLLDIRVEHCLLAGILCSIGGMLPDLDSDSGVPVREMLCLTSVLVPMLMVQRFHALGLGIEEMVMASAVIYVAIRFGFGTLFKKYTVHRGMWHSIPAAAIAGLFIFLVSFSDDPALRLFKAWAVVLGFISHLVLDEIYAVDWQGNRIRVKRSFGTAMKFFSKNKWANFSTYAKLLALIAIVLSDHAAMNYFGQEPIDLIPDFSAADWIRETMQETIMR